MEPFRKHMNRVKGIFVKKCSLPHSFAQEGEDMILSEIFAGEREGFYVDVGAHHPCRFSNTYHFYLRGWNGINIDATPGSMEPFRLHRARDINLELAIGERDCDAIFHIFNEPALNTFDAQLANERNGMDGRFVVKTQKIAICTLATVLERHLPFGQEIDFLTVDVEGFDLAVLRSNNWKRFCPHYVLAEDFFAESVAQALKTPVCEFLLSVGYEMFAKTAHTQMFRRKLKPV